jgi:hypothetical protein
VNGARPVESGAPAGATGAPVEVALRPAVRPPEPARFWVRYTPRGWPPPAGPWTDIAAGALGAAAGERDRGAAGRPLPDLAAPPLDDVLYLPPVPAAREAERRALARRRLADGTPVLLQVPLGGEAVEPAERIAEAGATVVYDPLPALAAGGIDRLERALARAGKGVAAGAVAVWPLVPGLADEAAAASRACVALAAAGIVAVQPLRLQLAPADRRRLAEAGGGGAFHALFHRPPPDERRFARAAAASGLVPLLWRPLPRPPLAGAGNRRLAGLLALAGELWLRIGRPEAQGQALFRAARWADGTAYEVAALAREGNLGVVEPLDAFARTVVEAALAGDGRATPPLIDELLAAWVAGSEEEPA